jgi:hypothetical protein
LRRAVVVEDEDAERVQVAHVDFASSAAEAQLGGLLEELLGQMTRKQVRVYHFPKQAYMPVGADCAVPVEFLGVD